MGGRGCWATDGCFVIREVMAAVTNETFCLDCRRDAAAEAYLFCPDATSLSLTRDRQPA